MTRTAGRARTIQPLLALFTGSAVTLTALLITRPRLAGGPASWSTDDLALECLWCAAVICSAWLTSTTVACIGALARGNPRAAHRVARWAPPLARRVLQAALISTWALVPAAAYATPATGPIVVHVGADGHLTTESGHPTESDQDALSDEPVVRTPPTSPSTSTPTTVAPTTTTTAPRVPMIPQVPTHDISTPARSTPARSTPARSTPARSTRPTAGSARRTSRVHMVQPGDNLWRIAESELARAAGRAPNDSQIAAYWQRVIAANRPTLRSGDPSLIFPGEIVTLP